MQSLIFIVIIIVMINALSKRAGKAKRVARRQIIEPKREHQDDIQPQMSALQADEAVCQSYEQVRYQDDYGCVGGSLPHEAHEGIGYQDDYGCVSGSLPHETHEGVGYQDNYGYVGSLPREAHEGMSFAFDKRPKSPIDNTYALEDFALSNAKRQLTARQMRSAVIMAEILSPPVSRRRR